MKIARIRKPKRWVISSISAVVLAALTVPLFYWTTVDAANTITGNSTMISINSSGSGGGNAGSSIEAVSEDGNRVLFYSNASDLPAPGSTTGFSAPFLRDVTSGTTVRVDTSQSGVIADAYVSAQAMSRNGRYIILRSSSATNLIDGTVITQDSPQLYVKDMQTGSVEKITINEGYMPSGAPNGHAISDDGRFVFVTTKYAGHYVPGVRTGYLDIIMYDRLKATWTLVDAPVSGSLQNVDALAIKSGTSCDGSIVAFSSAATNLVAGYSGSGGHLYIADIRNGVQITDITPGATLDSYIPSVSCNGRYVTFWTKDRTFVPSTPSDLDTNWHVVRYDRITGDRQYVDSNSSGAFSGAVTTAQLSISDAGDVVLPYLAPVSGWPGMKAPYVFLKHLSDGSGTLEHIRKTISGPYNPYTGSSGGVRFSANGKFIIYQTDGSATRQVVRAESGL